MNTLGQLRDLSSLRQPAYALITYYKQPSGTETATYESADNDPNKLIRQGKAQLKLLPTGSRAECIDTQSGAVINCSWK